MKAMALSRYGRAYVLAVIAVGGGLILSSVLELVFEATTPYWVVVVVLTLLSAPLALRVPSIRATVTVTETFVFASALLFGPAAATFTIALDGLFLSLWAQRRSVPRTLFNVGEPAISIWVASQLFYTVSGVQPLFRSSVGLGQLLLPLALLITAYFLLNTMLSVTALWCETRVNPLRFLREQLPHTLLNFFASGSFVVLLVLNLDNLTFAAVGVFAPLLALSYASSRLSTTRVEETNSHLNELSKLYLSTIEALALAIDAKDQVTSGHIRRVQLHSGGARARARSPRGRGPRDRGSRAAPRPRQAGRARAHPEQTRQAHVGRVRPDEDARRDRRGHPRDHRLPLSGRADRPLSPRNVGRQGIPGRDLG